MKNFWPVTITPIVIGVLMTLSGTEHKKESRTNVVLIIAHKGFQPHEYFAPKKELLSAGFTVTTVSDEPGTARAFEGTPAHVDQTVQELYKTDLKNLAGIFIVGGPGALECLDTVKVHDIMKRARDMQIVWGAICISPRILGNAGLLKDRKITGWNGDGKLPELCQKYECIYIKKEQNPNECEPADVYVDANLITACGPHAARAFGEHIVKLLKK